MFAAMPLLPTDPVRRGRAMLALLGFFFLLPVGASWLIWSFDLASGTTGNYGELLPPRPVALPTSAALKGKWILVQFDAAACAAGCERKLYFMRQVRRAQGKEMERVARLWLLTDAAAPSAELRAAIEGTLIAPASGRTDFPLDKPLASHIFLVDPLGNLMMRFPSDPDPARVIKDLQRLLKASGFG
jgi:hypothetical protein